MKAPSRNLRNLSEIMSKFPYPPERMNLLKQCCCVPRDDTFVIVKGPRVLMLIIMKPKCGCGFGSVLKGFLKRLARQIP